jgi:hypothetical protein
VTRPALSPRAAVLRCLRVQLAAWRAGVWGLELTAANDNATKPNAPPPK